MRPAPRISSATGGDGSPTDSVWWGQILTLHGEYLSPIARENVAYMYDLPVRGTSSDVPENKRFADSVTFVVPEDARAFSAGVSTYGKWNSIGAPWIYMSPPDLGPFVGITGLAWAPEDGHVWIAAPGGVMESDLFVMDPLPGWTTPFSRPYISRVTDNGTVLVVDRDAPGEIKEVNVITHEVTTFALTTDDEFTRTVDPVGLAVDPDGSVAYVADRNGGGVDQARLVAVPRDAGGPGSSEITDRFGDRDLNFADPCGIDVAPVGKVLVADDRDGVVYVLASWGTSEIVSVGFNVHSVEVDRDVSNYSLIRFMFSTDPAATEVFNLNPIGIHTGPQAGTEVPARYHGGRLFGMADGRLTLEPDGSYATWRHFPQPVILSNEVEDYPYPSEYQTEDRVIQLQGEVWAGVRLHLRLVDPPDLAAYAPDGGWPDSGDDAAGDPEAAVLPYEGADNVGYDDPDHGLSGSPNGPWSQTLDVVAAPHGGYGIYTYYLKVPERYSGDNFQVEITKVKADGSNTILTERVAAMTSVYTSWKRIFVERDTMFREGGVLAGDYDPDTCGGANLPCDQIRVYEWTNVDEDDWIVIFDEWAGAEEFLFFFDRLLPVRQVLTVGEADSNGLRVLTLDSPLDRPFAASPWEPDSGGNRQPLFCEENWENCHVSGFGVVSSCDLDWNQLNAIDSCFFNVDLRGVERSFGDAFVEVHAPRKGRNFLPFLPRNWMNWAIDYGSSGPPRPTDYFSWLWFHHRSDGASNYRHVIGAGKAGDYEIDQFLLGLSQHFNFHWSYVFRATIEDFGLFQTPPANVDQVRHHTEDTTVHELGHQFLVQACGDGYHHNDQLNPYPAWCSFPSSNPPVCPPDASSPELCLMNSGIIRGDNHQGWDPVMRFCKRCLFLGDLACSPGPGGIREGAIRTAVDPLEWD